MIDWRPITHPAKRDRSPTRPEPSAQGSAAAPCGRSPLGPVPTCSDPANAQKELPPTLDESFSPGIPYEAPTRPEAGSNEPTATRPHKPPVSRLVSRPSRGAERTGGGRLGEHHGAPRPRPPRSPGLTRSDPAHAQNEQPADFDGSFSPGTACKAPTRAGLGSLEPATSRPHGPSISCLDDRLDRRRTNPSSGAGILESGRDRDRLAAVRTRPAVQGTGA